MKKEPKQTKPSNRIGYFPENAPISGGASALEKQKPPKKNLLRPVLTAACAVVFVVCAVSLIRYFVDIGRARSASDELRRTYAASQTLPRRSAVPAPAETAVETAVPEPVSTPEALPTQTGSPPIPPPTLLPNGQPAMRTTPSCAFPKASRSCASRTGTWWAGFPSRRCWTSRCCSGTIPFI